MYARGILFGKMKYELGDHSVVRCPELGLIADIDFKTKGWVGGTYNAIGGNIRNEQTGELLFELSGLWSDEMFVKNLKVSIPSGFARETADTQADGTQGDVLQCASLGAKPPFGSPARGAGGTGVAKVVGQDCPSNKGTEPRASDR